VPVDRERLIMRVIGEIRQGRSDLSAVVGRVSRGQVELLDLRMILVISSGEAGGNEEKAVGEERLGGRCRGLAED
jgi:hypothetical protein